MVVGADDGVAVGVPASLGGGVGVGSGVALGVGLGVETGVGIAVGAAVGAGVGVAAGTGVAVGATVGAGVAVSDEQAAITTTNRMTREANKNVSCLDVIEAPFKKQVKANKPVAYS